MREQLMQLLNPYLDGAVPDEVIRDIADHLLDNGVIVPPVKVGQTVWYIDRYTGNMETDTASYLTVTKSGVHVQLVYHNRKFWDIYRQGKDVFLTREAAEAALKAREKNNVN